MHAWLLVVLVFRVAFMHAWLFMFVLMFSHAWKIQVHSNYLYTYTQYIYIYLSCIFSSLSLYIYIHIYIYTSPKIDKDHTCFCMQIYMARNKG